MARTIQINGYRYVLNREPSFNGWLIYRTKLRPLRNCPGHFSGFSCGSQTLAGALESAREDAQHSPGGLYYRP